MKAKKRRLSPRKLLKIRRKEKDLAVRDRIMLNVHIERDGMSMSMAAPPLGHGPVMWRQVAPSLPGGGNKRAADPSRVRKAAMDPEGDHE